MVPAWLRVRPHQTECVYLPLLLDRSHNSAQPPGSGQVVSALPLTHTSAYRVNQEEVVTPLRLLLGQKTVGYTRSPGIDSTSYTRIPFKTDNPLRSLSLLISFRSLLRNYPPVTSQTQLPRQHPQTARVTSRYLPTHKRPLVNRRRYKVASPTCQALKIHSH